MTTIEILIMGLRCVARDTRQPLDIRVAASQQADGYQQTWDRRRRQEK